MSKIEDKCSLWTKIYIAIAALWGTSACRGKLTPVLVFYTQVRRWWQ